MVYKSSKSHGRRPQHSVQQRQMFMCFVGNDTHTHTRKAHQGKMGRFIGTIHSIRRHYHQTTANNKKRERIAFRIRHCARIKKIIASPYVYRIYMAFFCSSIANGRSRTIGDSLFRSNVIRRSVVSVIRSFHHCCVYMLRVVVVVWMRRKPRSAHRVQMNCQLCLWMCLARASLTSANALVAILVDSARAHVCVRPCVCAKLRR
jgi:hypothetical protein